MRPFLGDLDHFSSDDGRNLGTVLIEGLGGDAVGKPLHHQRAIGDDGKQLRRDPRVVAEQIALGQLQLRPEDLVKVGHRERVAVRQRDVAVAAELFELRQLIDHGAGIEVDRSRGGATACGWARCALW
jgi:hypothetical protein